MANLAIYIKHFGMPLKQRNMLEFKEFLYGEFLNSQTVEFLVAFSVLEHPKIPSKSKGAGIPKFSEAI